MAKLTEAQRRVLARMATGDEVWTVTGRSSSTFWHGNMTDRSPSFPTLHAMWKAGVIESYEGRGGNKYRISEAGRAALTAQEPRHD